MYMSHHLTERFSKLMQLSAADSSAAVEDRVQDTDVCLHTSEICLLLFL